MRNGTQLAPFDLKDTVAQLFVVAEVKARMWRGFGGTTEKDFPLTSKEVLASH